MSQSRRTFSVKAHDVNWLPWSEWMTVPGPVGLEWGALAKPLAGIDQRLAPPLVEGDSGDAEFS